MAVEDFAKSPVCEGTIPKWETLCADTNQTGIKPYLLVYKTGTAAANAVTLATQFFGDAIKDESQLYVVDHPESNPAFPKSYDKDTAFPVIGTPGSSFRGHKIEVNDVIIVKGSALTCDENDVLICGANGLVELIVGTTTPDKYNVHLFKPIKAYTSATYLKVRAMARGVIDSS